MSGWGSGMWRSPPPGVTRIGRYRLLAEIGRGGMGAVFLAIAERPEGFRKLVAIKTLLARRSDERFAAMLLDEARVASRLEHPNIAHLFDADLHDGEPYLVMEYVHGESLAAVLETDGRLPYHLAALIISEIADALEHAHRLEGNAGEPLGLVHRDVSPQNIVLGYRGVAKLVDFGIARGPGRSTHTESGVIKGRLDYMPPEQRRGGPVDGRADQYALGLVLLEATTGVHVSAASSVPDLLALPDDYPDALVEIVRRATAERPEDRFVDARAMHDALHEFLADVLPRHVGRTALADYLHDGFADRRAAKEAMMSGDLGREATEILGIRTTPNAAATGDDGAPPRRAGRSRWTMALAIASSLATVGALTTWRPDGELAAAPAVGAPERVCLLVSVEAAPEDRDATWAAARMIGMAMDHAPAPVVVHGYRAQDRYGWSVGGTMRAREACIDAGAPDAITITGHAHGDIEAAIDGEAAPIRAPGPRHEASRRIAAAVVERWSGTTWQPPPLDARLDVSALEVRESFMLQRDDPRGPHHADSTMREHPDLEEPYLWIAIGAWWSGALARDGPSALRQPPTPSRRFTELFDAVVELARGPSEPVADEMLSLLEDRRHAADPIAVYLAAEALFHLDRPGEGARLFERALEIDPQLMPAVYHLFERRLADGDWSRAAVEADRWRRIDPSDSHWFEYSLLIALGRGQYRHVEDMFTRLLDGSRVDTLDLRVPDVALVWARALRGDSDGAFEHALRVSQKRGPRAELAHLCPEPVAYALALFTADETEIAAWELRYHALLQGERNTPNQQQLAYVAATVDALAGRAGARERWLDSTVSDGVDKGYRFAPHRLLFEGLEAFAARDSARLHELARTTAAPTVTHLLQALAHRLAGFEADARTELEAALSATWSGDFDCIAAGWLADSYRREQRTAEAERACERVLEPFVPRPYCLAVRHLCESRADALPEVVHDEDD